jgi:hypothetical protein
MIQNRLPNHILRILPTCPLCLCLHHTVLSIC